MLTLNCETKEFTNDKGENTEYKRYFVEYMGVQIELKPIDKTGKEFLNCIYSQKVGDKNGK